VKRRTQRETLKELKRASIAGGGPANFKNAKALTAISNDQCSNCYKYLETIEKYEKEMDDLNKQINLLRLMGGN